MLDGRDHSAIGNGRFGSCSQMAYKDLYVVCVKRMEKDVVSLQALKSEGAILCSLNGGGFTPHCFGVCLSLHAIVMSYINVLNKSVTLFAMLYENLRLISFSSQQCSDMLVDLCRGVQYVHSSGFLHNDLKLDNVVLGNSLSGKLKPYIIDFGKACPVTKGRTYSLSNAEINMYKKEHPQIAPDLRDGHVKQSVSSDLFSLGRIMKRCNSVVIHSTELSPLIRQALSYHCRDRPSIEAILSLLTKQ
jgi:serine/threonine protein kinase